MASKIKGADVANVVGGGLAGIGGALQGVSSGGSSSSFAVAPADPVYAATGFTLTQLAIGAAVVGGIIYVTRR